jgi:hypothetical protein
MFNYRVDFTKEDGSHDQVYVEAANLHDAYWKAYEKLTENNVRARLHGAQMSWPDFGGS